MRRVVVENEHVRLEVDEPRKVLWIVRSASRPEVPGELAAALEGLRRHMPPDVGSWGLVLDTRAAPGRNDGEWERGLRQQRASLAVFGRAVVLVNSAAGQLHLQRLAREEGLPVMVTQDELDADRLAAG